MDWLSPSSRPAGKNVEFYQRKALSFLFSAEGKDDLRALHIPYAQLGFYSPMHFLSLIPGEMCEPYRNDRLFLASSGMVRKGDKVLLLERETEGIIKSAVFKERRVRKNGETEILLDGHRQTYREDEVVPYKTHLREQLGTSLVPESNFAISEDGILDWEEPTWEPGQEVYYKPEKRWATILSREEHAKGKIVVLIKLDATHVKKEKTTRLPLKELRADSVPLRVPRRVQGDSAIASSGSSFVDDHSHSSKARSDGGKEVSERRPHSMMMLPRHDNDRVDGVIENRYRDEHGMAEISSNDSATRGETIYAEVLPKTQRTPQAKESKGMDLSNKGIFSFLWKKPKQRPVSEYYPPDESKENAPSYHPTDPSKSKSCNNLNAKITDDDDDDDEDYESKNYTNSLRSSARKIIQKQLARESTRSASLKAPSNAASRPHVAEIFTVNNSNTMSRPRNEMYDDEMGMPVKPMRTKQKRPASMGNELGNDNNSQRYGAMESVDYTKKPSIYSPTSMVQANSIVSSSSTITQQSSRAPVMSTSYESYTRSSQIPSSLPTFLLASPAPTMARPYSRQSPVSAAAPSYARSSPTPMTAQSYLRSSSPTPLATTSYGRASPTPLATTSYARSSPTPMMTAQSYLRSSSPTPLATTSYGRASPTPLATTSYARSSPTPMMTAQSYLRSSSPTPLATTSYSRQSPLPASTTSYLRSSSPTPLASTSYSRQSPLPVTTPTPSYSHSRSSPLARSPSPTNLRPSSPLEVVTSSYSRTSPVSLIIQQFQNNSVASPTSPTPPATSSAEERSTPQHAGIPPRFNLRPLPSLEYLWKNKKPNPLDYKFVPLASSELVKKQDHVVNRVLYEPENNMSTDYVVVTPLMKSSEPTGVYSDSSSHDNDSGRGSYQADAADKPKLQKARVTDLVYETSPKTRRHPTFQQSPTITEVDVVDVDTSYTVDKSATINKNLERRYTKNRALSKHALSKYTNNNEENENHEEEYKNNMPHPYNPANLSHVAGYGKGIQGAANSSFADATLYALFACSNIFDKHLLFSKPGQVERGLKRDIRTILCNRIVTPLRLNAYCKSENISHLREAMLPLSSKIHSSLMDAEEFLYLLLDTALNIESFIELSNGSKDYMHQIIARPKDRSKSQTVQFMLETSLGTSGQKFKRVPMPALFLCMPRCKGRLVYYEAIIPSLQLNITRLLHRGPKQCVCEMAATLECSHCHRKNGDIALDFCDICKGIADQIHFRLDHSPVLTPKSQKDEILNLHSIICTRGNRYVAFVKASEQRLSPWLFFDPMAGDYPEVTLLEDFGRWLDSLEKQPGSFREFAKLHPLLKRVMTDGHIYIYSKSHLADDKTFSESFAI